MLRRITLVFLAAVMVLSLISCSSVKRPAVYDEEILTVNGEKITYEFYRYYYLSAYQSYGEADRDQIMGDVLNKLLYDRAVDLILTADNIALTAEEQAELDSMLEMYETTYGVTFQQELENQNMTVDVFKQTMTYMVKYNKLYEHYAKEENKKLDFSDAGIKAVMDDYNAGLHFVINKGGKLTNEDAKALTEQVYAMMEIALGFKSAGQLLSLKDSIKQTQSAIEDINNQIEGGSTDTALVTSLTTLTKKLSELNDQLAKSDYTDGIKSDLSVYLAKLGVYSEIAKKNVNDMVNSDHTELVAAMNSGDLSAVKAQLNSLSNTLIESKLITGLENVVKNTSAYGWVSNDFKTAVENFKAAPSVDGAKAINGIYNSSEDMKKDTLLTNINKVVLAYIDVSSDLSCYKYVQALTSANGLLEIKSDFEVLVAEYAACLEAEYKAKELLDGLNSSAIAGNDISYEDLLILDAMVYDFEELIKKYSDGYNAESETQMFYYQNGDLIDELTDVVSKLSVGQYTNVIESPTSFHIFKVIEKDTEHFKENYFVYAALEEKINEKAATIEYTTTELYNSLNEEKIKELEKQLDEQIKEISGTEEEGNDNTLLWTVIIIIATVAVVVVLAVAIVYSSKAPAPKQTRNKGKYKVSEKKNGK